VEVALAVCRFAHFLAATTLFGASAYFRLQAPPTLRAGLDRAARRVAAAAILVAALSALVWLALEGAAMSGSWAGSVDFETLGDVLADTAFGAVWRGRLLVALALLVAWAFGRHGPSAFLLVASALLLASLGLVGHAAMQSGALGALHRLNHALHLLAAGAWLGGLPAFALSLAAYRDAALRREAVAAMRRFSDWGRLAVAAVVATGAANVAIVSGAPPLPPTTPYRALLDAKLALVAAMVALALLNRHVLAPRLRSGAAAFRALMATTVAEIVLGAAVVALVSVFGLCDPN
jgi:putative copper resistance protein D